MSTHRPGVVEGLGSDPRKESAVILISFGTEQTFSSLSICDAIYPFFGDLWSVVNDQRDILLRSRKTKDLQITFLGIVSYIFRAVSPSSNDGCANGSGDRILGRSRVRNVHFEA